MSSSSTVFTTTSSTTTPTPSSTAVAPLIPFSATLPLKWTAEHTSSLFISALLPVSVRKPTIVSYYSASSSTSSSSAPSSLPPRSSSSSSSSFTKGVVKPTSASFTEPPSSSSSPATPNTNDIINYNNTSYPTSSVSINETNKTITTTTTTTPTTPNDNTKSGSFSLSSSMISVNSPSVASSDWSSAAEACIGLIETLAISRQVLIELFPAPPVSIQHELEELVKTTGADEALEQSFISYGGHSLGGGGGGGGANDGTNTQSASGGSNGLLGLSSSYYTRNTNHSMENLLDLNELSQADSKCCGSCCSFFTRPKTTSLAAASTGLSRSSGLFTPTNGNNNNGSNNNSNTAGQNTTLLDNATNTFQTVLRGSHEGITPDILHNKVKDYLSLLLGLVFDLRAGPVPFSPSSSSSSATTSTTATSTGSKPIVPSPLSKAIEFTWSSVLLPQDQYFSVSDAMFEFACIVINEGLWCMQYAHKQELIAREQRQRNRAMSQQQTFSSSSPQTPRAVHNNNNNSNNNSAPNTSSSSSSSSSSPSLYVANSTIGLVPSISQSALVKASSAFEFVRNNILAQLPVASNNQLSQYPELTGSVLLALRYQCVAEQAELVASEFTELASSASITNSSSLLAPLLIEKVFPLCLVAAGQYQAAHDSLARVLASDERSLPLLSRWIAHIRTRLAYFTARCYFLKSLSLAASEQCGYAIKCADHALLLLDAIVPSSSAGAAAGGKKRGFLSKKKPASVSDGSSSTSTTGGILGGILNHLNSENDSSSVAVWKRVVAQLRQEIEPHLAKCRRDNEFIYFQPLPMDLPTLDPPPISSLPPSLVINIPQYELPTPDERWHTNFVYNILIDGNKSYLTPDARRASNKSRTSSNFFDRFTRTSSSNSRGSHSRKKSTSKPN